VQAQHCELASEIVVAPDRIRLQLIRQRVPIDFVVRSLYQKLGRLGVNAEHVVVINELLRESLQVPFPKIMKRKKLWRETSV